MKWYLKVIRHYFDGRACRSEFWYFMLFNIIVSFLLLLLDMLINLALLQGVYLLVITGPGLAVSVRRMHDVGKSGWYLFIPVYNILLACTKGTTGENKYGPEPNPQFPTFDFEQQRRNKVGNAA